MTYIDPSKAIIAKMIAFDKECIYTHLVSPPPPPWDSFTRRQKLRWYIHKWYYHDLLSYVPFP